ncbi:hypothetical protein [Chryseobacterium koreense]|uniref:Lipoprotein n=1 Tax=Chryseobacterium koreense CCUG 49689 TaxID=1304281 RepID=A0A0J7IX15_9FLAO|nr:hypothetical protein [Chryseobacterium koreense]KMQ70354.1 hypothetical protein ACM44_12745 [Chryseobacterium koreense CCUG 49689]MBB5334654.1 hypothetical protein [Chryseobacterium koreense]
MKKLLLIIPLLLFSCDKKEAVGQNDVKEDSVVTIPENNPDTVNEAMVPIEKQEPKPSNTFRVVEGDKIIKTINGEMIPLKIQDEFTKDNQQYVLKIKNFSNKRIEGKIEPESSEMNIRFNQIKLANGDLDGPFGRDISYDIQKTGEIWLIIGKSNMASGDAKGKFSVSIK